MGKIVGRIVPLWTIKTPEGMLLWSSVGIHLSRRSAIAAFVHAYGNAMMADHKGCDPPPAWPKWRNLNAKGYAPARVVLREVPDA